jgi:hypothetical protein
MHEEVIRQRDIELEGKDEHIRNLLSEGDSLRARLRKADAAGAALQAQLTFGTFGQALSVATLVVAAGGVAVLLMLLLLRDHWPTALSLGTLG